MGQDDWALGWGANGYWQLGDGSSTASRLTPTVMPGLTGVDIKALTAGGPISGPEVTRGFGLALLDNGTVQSWGSNVDGELGDGTNSNRAMPGAVVGLTDVVAIASGGPHSLALRADGTVWAWGLNNFGELGNNTFTSSSVPVAVQGLTNVIAIAAGSAHSLALRADGTVWAWGLNAHGELGDGTTTNRAIPAPVQNLTGVRSIAGGGWHSLALRSDGTVWAWGYNDNGELGNGTTGGISTTPVSTLNLSNVKAIAAGGNHNLTLRADGTVSAWGFNDFGELGNNTNITSPVPVQVIGIQNTTIEAIAAGSRHSLALSRDGSVFAWGHNGFGQLGDGTITHRWTPVQPIANNSDTRFIAAPVFGFFSYAA